jgi:hypothetical protein
LIASLIHWFTDSLAHWCIDSLFRWFIDSLVCWFIGSLIHWFIGSLIHWFIWLIGSSLIHWFIGSIRFSRWFIALLLHWFIGFWFIDSLSLWFIDSLQYFKHSLTHCFIASLLHWFTDSLIHWMMDSSSDVFFHVISFESQQPVAHSLMHLTNSTLHCFCISKKLSYGPSSSYSCFIFSKLLPRCVPGTIWYLYLSVLCFLVCGSPLEEKIQRPRTNMIDVLQHLPWLNLPC